MGFFGGLMKVISIIAVAILTVLIILCGVMFLFPSVSMFQYHYVNMDYGTRVFETLRDNDGNTTLWDNADIIRIDASAYSVEVRTKEKGELIYDGDIVVKMTGYFRGFAKGEFSYSDSIKDNKYIEEDEKKIFYVDVNTPYGGLVVWGNPTISLIIYENTFANKDVEIITSSGSIILGKDNNLSFKGVSLTADTGSIKLNNFSIDGSRKLDINKKSGSIEVTKDLECDTDISIQGGYGTVNLKNIGTTINNKKLTVDASNSHLTVENIYGDFEFTANGGLLNIGTITGSTNLNIASCDCYIGTIKGGLYVTGRNEGSIICEKVDGVVNVQVNGGYIELGETGSSVLWESPSGTLVLSKAKAEVTATTERGNIEVYCDTNYKFDLNLINNYGNITFDCARGKVIAGTKENGKGSGSVSGSFYEVSDCSEITTYSGRISIEAIQTEWWLNWATLGSADINMGSLRSTASTIAEEYTNQIWVNVLDLGTSTDSTKTNGIKLQSVSGSIALQGFLLV